MCGRFANAEDVKFVAIRFGAEIDAGEAGVEEWKPTWNAAPTQRLPVVTATPAGRRVSLMRWSWPIGFKPGIHVNAVGETAHAKRPFAESFRARRCIVPASAFYEWHERSRTVRVPWAFTVDGGDLFGIAALWQSVAIPGGPASAGSAPGAPAAGAAVPAFLLLTTEANAVVRPVHHRMAAILPREAEAAWLDPATPVDDLRALLVPFAAGRMAARAVSARVNSVRNDGPELLNPAPEPPREATWFDADGDG